MSNGEADATLRRKYAFCDICDKKIKDRFLDSHRGIHTVQEMVNALQNNVNCDICNKKIKKKDMVAHRLIHHVGVQCSKCLEKLVYSRKHSVRHFKERTHINCLVASCHRRFDGNEEFEWHLKEDHEINEKGVKCKFCNKEYQNIYFLVAHVCHYHAVDYGLGFHYTYLSEIPQKELSVQPIVDGESANQCSSETPTELTPSTTNRTCVIQAMDISQPASTEEESPDIIVLEDEEKVVEKESLKCIPCGMTFPDQRLLIFHNLFHSSTDPFLCAICGGKFGDRYEFTAHLYILEHSSIQSPVSIVVTSV